VTSATRDWHSREDAPSHASYSGSFDSAKQGNLHLQELTISAKELFELLMPINPRMIKKIQLARLQTSLD